LQLSAFVKGQFIVCTILFTIYACGLGLLRIELWFLIAFIAGYGNFIPYFGFVSGILLATLMTMVTYGDFLHLLLTWSVFGFAQLLEGSFITPKIVGDSVGLSPLVIMLALVAGGTLFGLLGICLAIPLAAIIKVLGSALLKHLYAGE
jgi:predicted PurR-regulated permease PerM